MNNELIGRLQAVVGAEHAFAADDPRAAPYRDIFTLDAEAAAEYEAVALPGDVESLQETVRLAVREGLSVWSTFNAAGNGAQAGSAGMPGLVIDLRRLDRILDVDTASACALVEPGVSFRQLHEHLQKHGIALLVDSDRDPGNSIAGSICSREVGCTPYGDHLLMQCGLEVVLPDGELLRTGMGALPGSDTWQLFKYNFGPYYDGLFTQSGMGLVSKAGLWLMPPPPKVFPFMVALDGDGALAQAIEIVRPFRIGNLIAGTIVIASAQMDAAPYARRVDYLDGGRLDPEKLKSTRDCGDWNLYAALYDAPENLQIAWEAVSGALSAIPGIRIFTEGDRPDDPAWQDRQRLMRGGLAEKGLSLDGWGSDAAMYLVCAAPMEGEYALRMRDITRGILAERGLDLLCEYALSGRTMLMRIFLPYRRADADTFRNAQAAGRVLIETMSRAGFGITGESIGLRRIADAIHARTALAGLAGRLHDALGRVGPRGAEK
jgi:4-cresol dehydrogenase (hydroxylating)